MDAQADSIQLLQCQAASLLLYQSVLVGEAGHAFLSLLQALQHPDSRGINCLRAYGDWFKALAGRGESWQDYLITKILTADNPFTRQAQRQLVDMPPALVAAAQQDLRTLQHLYTCSSTQLSHWVQEAANLPVAPVPWSVEAHPATVGIFQGCNPHHVRQKLGQVANWADALEELMAYYRQSGTGLFTYGALGWQSGELQGISHPDQVQLGDLVGCEPQKEALLKNTEFLLAGYSALHVLLYGSRGSGKSSLVKALLPKYYDRGLRLVEVAKADLKDLGAIAQQLQAQPQKFIIFVDDLSFEADETAYKSLKVLLEGSLSARPQNVVVYATSNRRHLIREYFGERPRPSSEEVHAWDTVQEKLSLSDRFGLLLTFEPANQNTYLAMVQHLATTAGIPLSREELEYRALQWATRHNGRSGRTARQFVSFLQADLGISLGGD